MSHRRCLSALMGLARALIATLIATLIVTLIATVPACSEPDSGSPAAGATSLPIIGGDFDQGDDAVAEIQVGNGFSTGTLIAPRVVLTASAHCVELSVQPLDSRDLGLSVRTIGFGLADSVSTAARPRRPGCRRAGGGRLPLRGVRYRKLHLRRGVRR